MVLILHIFVAILSMLNAAVLYFLPSRFKFLSAYALIALTLVSGTYMIISSQASMVRTCVNGMVYLVVILGILNLAHKRQSASEKINNQ